MPDENILKLKEYYNSTFCRTEKYTPFFCKYAKNLSLLDLGWVIATMGIQKNHLDLSFSMDLRKDLF